jgi:hypothetical protein
MTTGLVVSSVTRSLQAGSSKVSIANGDGASGDPTIDIVEANINVANLGGTFPSASIPHAVLASSTAYNATLSSTYPALGDSRSSWFTLTIGSEVSDPSSIVSLSSDQFTLGAGKYEIDVVFHAHTYGQAGFEQYVPSPAILRARLYNVTDSAAVGNGEPTAAGSYSNIRGEIHQVVTITDTKAFRVEATNIGGVSTPYSGGYRLGYKLGDLSNTIQGNLDHLIVTIKKIG